MLSVEARNRDASALFRSIETRDARVGILGLGYAGLPLALAFAEAGFTTVGVDVDPHKVHEINAGRSPVSSVPSSLIHAVTSAGQLQATTNAERIRTLDCIVVCVPTPLNAAGEPDTQFIKSAMHTVAEHLPQRSLVVLQSSSYPGSTQEIACPILEEGGWQAGEDFYLAYAPERIDPGNSRFGVKNTPKLVGGMTPECGRLACHLFQQIVETVVPVESPDVAEIAKLVENTFRFINISFVNELAILCDRLGLDVWQVIQAASTKPFAFLLHNPGPGVGGDCIPVMPLYLEWAAGQAGLGLETVAAARRVNDQMPRFVVGKLARLLRERVGKSLRGARVLVIGVTYKPNVADVRNAPSLAILSQLLEIGIDVSYHDPLIPAIRIDGVDLSSIELDRLSDFDALILVTPHQTIDYDRLVASGALVLDTQNALANRPASNVIHL
jgi:UDP-N-acetyl-D-glucosamine dehydrogenase